MLTFDVTTDGHITTVKLRGPPHLWQVVGCVRHIEERLYRDACCLIIDATQCERHMPKGEIMMLGVMLGPPPVGRAPMTAFVDRPERAELALLRERVMLSAWRHWTPFTRTESAVAWLDIQCRRGGGCLQPEANPVADI